MDAGCVVVYCVCFGYVLRVMSVVLDDMCTARFLYMLEQIRTSPCSSGRCGDVLSVSDRGIETNPGISYLPSSLQLPPQHDRSRGQLCTLCHVYLGRSKWRHPKNPPRWLVEETTLCSRLQEKLYEEEKSHGFSLDDHRQPTSLCGVCIRFVESSRSTSPALRDCLTRLEALSADPRVHNRRSSDCSGGCPLCRVVLSKQSSNITQAPHSQSPSPRIAPDVPKIPLSVLINARAESGMSIRQCEKFLKSIDRQISSTLAVGFKFGAVKHNALFDDNFVAVDFAVRGKDIPPPTRTSSDVAAHSVNTFAVTTSSAKDIVLKYLTMRGIKAGDVQYLRLNLDGGRGSVKISCSFALFGDDLATSGTPRESGVNRVVILAVVPCQEKSVVLRKLLDMLDISDLMTALPRAEMVFCQDMKASNAICGVSEHGGVHACLRCYFSRFRDSRPDKKRGFHSLVSDYRQYSDAVDRAASAGKRRPQVKEFGNVWGPLCTCLPTEGDTVGTIAPYPLHLMLGLLLTLFMLVQKFDDKIARTWMEQCGAVTEKVHFAPSFTGYNCRKLMKGWQKLAALAPDKYVVAQSRKQTLRKRRREQQTTHPIIMIAEAVRTLSNLVEKVFLHGHRDTKWRKIIYDFENAYRACASVAINAHELFGEYSKGCERFYPQGLSLFAEQQFDAIHSLLTI